MVSICVSAQSFLVKFLKEMLEISEIHELFEILELSVVLEISEVLEMYTILRYLGCSDIQDICDI